ncbi:MAG TPA: prolyl oligopeptidase family serine peptidase [Micromonosporaceae bacterium]|nr:prolyl oligopeptidase family serine peptidase [Micromonosporaceae bacterium]
MAGYPLAERLDLVEDLFGHCVADPYRWLEDPADPRTIAWSAAQDELARARLDSLPGRAALAARLEPLLRAGGVGTPVWRAGRAFFTRRQPHQEHWVLCVREPDGRVRVLVDVNADDPTGLTVLDGWAPSREGNRLAYLLSVGGDEESRLYVLDVETGERIEGPIDRVRFTPIGWLPGGDELVYVRRLPAGAVPAGEAGFHRRVWRHKVGSDPDQSDVLLHGEGLAPTMLYDLCVSDDGRWLVITATLGTAPNTWLWLADLRTDEPPRQLLRYDDNVRVVAWVDHDGRLYLRTTLGTTAATDGASGGGPGGSADRWRLCVADPTAPDPAHWTQLLAEDPEAVLDDVRLLPDGRRLAALRTRHAVSELSLHDATTGAQVGDVELPGLGTVLHMSTVDQLTTPGRDRLWLQWTDFFTPPSVYLHADGRTELEAPAPGAVPPPEVRVTQVSYPSQDGTTVRMFVLSPPDAPDAPDVPDVPDVPDAPPDRPAEPRPALLTGYGGFAISMVPEYTPAALAWVAAGGVYAVPSLRGGGEEGEQWHQAGMREHKQRVFDDFHAAAQHLVAGGWTTPDRLAVTGGSNGGLLVGAALTQRPDLYRAVVCAKPLLDMVRYERFLIGRFWKHEYGSAEDPEELGWLLSYSPYHRVVAGTAYPAVLLTSYEADARTDPCHARKMCAALQHATAAGPATHPVLLRREVGVGHGARAVSRALALSVDMLAFLGWATGLTGDTGTAGGSIRTAGRS